MTYDTVDGIVGCLLAFGLPIGYIVAAVILHRRATSTRAWHLYWVSSVLAFLVLSLVSLRLDNWFPPPFDASLDCDPNRGGRGGGMMLGAALGGFGCLVNGLVCWLIGWRLLVARHRLAAQAVPPRWRQAVVALVVIAATVLANPLITPLVGWLATTDALTIDRPSNQSRCPSSPRPVATPTPSPTPWKWGDSTEKLPKFDPSEATWTQAEAKQAVDDLVTAALQSATSATDEPPANHAEDPKFTDSSTAKSCDGGVQDERRVEFSATSSQPVEDMFALFKKDGYKEYLGPDVYSTLDFSNPIDTIHAGTTNQNIGYIEVTSRCTP